MSSQKANTASKEETPALKKWYFLLSIILPLLLAITSTVVISIHERWDMCWSGSCFNTFVSIYKVPINLLGITIVTTSLSLAYYRSELSHLQTQKMLVQHVATIYNNFRDEFMATFEDSQFEANHKLLKIRPNWLFTALYPHAKNDNRQLNVDFEQLILNNPKTESFEAVMYEMRKLQKEGTGFKKYEAPSYKPVIFLFMTLEQIISFDVDVNTKYEPEDRFEDLFANNTIGILSDMLDIFSIVNAFEGWRFFDNRQRLRWEKTIGVMQKIAKESLYISKSIQMLEPHIAKLKDKRYETLNVDITSLIHQELLNNLTARNYIFEHYITGKFEGYLNKIALQALAQKLDVSSEEYN